VGLGPRAAHRQRWDPLSPSQDTGVAGLGRFRGAADVLGLLRVGDMVPTQPGQPQPCTLAPHGFWVVLCCTAQCCTHPGQCCPHPGQCCTHPGQSCTHPGQCCTRPGQCCLHPGQCCTHPEQSCTHPGQSCPHPGQSCTHPGQSCTHPGQSCTHSGQCCIHPGRCCAHPGQHSAQMGQAVLHSARCTPVPPSQDKSWPHHALLGHFLLVPEHHGARRVPAVSCLYAPAALVCALHQNITGQRGVATCHGVTLPSRARAHADVYPETPRLNEYPTHTSSPGCFEILEGLQRAPLHRS